MLMMPDAHDGRLVASCSDKVRAADAAADAHDARLVAHARAKPQQLMWLMMLAWARARTAPEQLMLMMLAWLGQRLSS